MGKITVFHGSFCEISIPEIRISHNTKDFGPGFYCTNLRDQAERWSKRYVTPRVNTYSVRMNESLKILEFHEMTEKWLDFIVACRAGVSHHWDLVIGPMADDQIYNYISNFIEGEITREQFWTMVKFRYPTHQMAFCTSEALKCLEFRCCEEVERL